MVSVAFTACIGGSSLLGQSDFSKNKFSKLVTQDAPEYWWNFEADAGKKIGKIASVEGPDERFSVTLGGKHQALYFPGDGSRVEIPDAENLRFKNGDSITIEAWVRLDKADGGANVYLVGKGRSTAQKDNQNWALRLHHQGGSSKLSFLFRSVPGEKEAQYHRWTSSDGVTADGKWHHVAVAYEFGNPQSVRGYIDGSKQSGKWDMGGATTQAPVVDDDNIVIGSSRGGAPQNSFHGAMDEIAIYRKALPDERLRQRFKRVVRPSLAPDLAKVSAKEVLVEIREGEGKRNVWSSAADPANESLGIQAFSLTSLPQVYNERASRQDRKLPLHVRMAAKVTLPEGQHTFLFRTPGLSRLKLDGKAILEMPYLHISGSAHGHPRDQETQYPYPKLHMGTHEKEVSVEGGRTVLIEAEGMVGDPARRLSINEFLVAVKWQGQEDWRVLSANGGEGPKFDVQGFAAFKAQQEAQFKALEAQKRENFAKLLKPEIEKRHAYARRYIQSLPELQLPKDANAENPSEVIDAYLSVKMDGARSKMKNQAHISSEPHHAEAIQILEANCFQCHGDKSSGGLKLNSRDAALSEGKSGMVAVIPNQPDKSELLYRLITDDPDSVMPPEGKGLTKDQVEVVRRWIAEGAPWVSTAAKIQNPAKLEDLAFLRRLYLNTVGVLPNPTEIQAYLELPEAQRDSKTIDQLLKDPRFADHWVSHWQDALAENPRLIKPVLNNTGPFRYWIHEALLDGKPMDQFAADLITFQGSVDGGGAGGFARAAENDVPMAAKAHVVGNAFLGVEMKCARCHDSPYHSTKQEDLFSLAALLSGKPITLPNTSTVPAAFFEREGKSNSVVKVTLKPGTSVAPKWPFMDLVKAEGKKVDVAWEIIRPENRRFAEVLVNRVWKQYFGQGFVEPVHDWEGNEASHPELLEYLSRQFVLSGYDLRALSRMILSTDAFRKEGLFARAKAPEDRYFEAPLRKRFSAEQMVDSLLSASGVPNFSEELTFDVEGVFNGSNFLNMGYPKRAWQMIATASDRDRPSLTLPNADSILAVMSANGWRDERPEPVSERFNESNLLQPGMLGNGVMGIWVTRLSDYSELTRLAVQAKSPEALVENLFLRYLTREPSAEELAGFLKLIAPGFEQRVLGKADGYQTKQYVPDVRELSWTNHLSVGASKIAADIETKAYKGPPATQMLESKWRERMEDAVWALVNSPELPFVP